MSNYHVIIDCRAPLDDSRPKRYFAPCGSGVSSRATLPARDRSHVGCVASGTACQINPLGRHLQTQLKVTQPQGKWEEGQLQLEHLELERNRRECLQARLEYSSERPVLKPSSVQHDEAVGGKLRVRRCSGPIQPYGLNA